MGLVEASRRHRANGTLAPGRTPRRGRPSLTTSLGIAYPSTRLSPATPAEASGLRHLAGLKTMALSAATTVGPEVCASPRVPRRPLACVPLLPEPSASTALHGGRKGAGKPRIKQYLFIWDTMRVKSHRGRLPWTCRMLLKSQTTTGERQTPRLFL